MAVIADHIQTPSSSLMQSKLDIHKRFSISIKRLLFNIAQLKYYYIPCFPVVCPLCLYSEQELLMEQSLCAVILLSLVGVDCVVGSQWHTSVQITSESMCKFIGGKWLLSFSLNCLGFQSS